MILANYINCPSKNWVKSVQFIGDNINKQKRVRDERCDNLSKMMNMYSILVSKCRMPSYLSKTGTVANLQSLKWNSFLPSREDVVYVKHNLIVLTFRLLMKFFHDLTPYSKCVPEHILHKYSDIMADKSEHAVIDVLLKDETKHSDMTDIMTFMQDTLGKEFPDDERVLSMGDLLTCERQIGSQRHLMDGNTPRERLELLEPQAVNWYFQLCMLQVNICMYM
jgi:hypothetical protein